MEVVGCTPEARRDPKPPPIPMKVQSSRRPGPHLLRVPLEPSLGEALRSHLPWPWQAVSISTAWTRESRVTVGSGSFRVRGRAAVPGFLQEPPRLVLVHMCCFYMSGRHVPVARGAGVFASFRGCGPKKGAPPPPHEVSNPLLQTLSSRFRALDPHIEKGDEGRGHKKAFNQIWCQDAPLTSGASTTRPGVQRLWFLQWRRMPGHCNMETKIL